MKRRHSERGGALLEFAIVAPFMMMMFFAAVEFGWVVFLNQTVDYAARVGTRWAAFRGASCTNTSVCPATAAEIEAYITQTVPVPNPSFNIQWVLPPGSYNAQPNGGACGPGALEVPSCLVEVTVSTPWQFVVPYVYTGKITISSTSTATIQQ